MATTGESSRSGHLFDLVVISWVVILHNLLVVNRIMELVCSVQKYLWGKLGEKSVVAQLARNNSGEEVKTDVPYSELWMGVHPNGPSRLKETKLLLEEHLQKSSQLYGASRDVFGPNLPYLFKVLSVAKALSIQAHPAKAHAEILHKQYPHEYKDPNHKPEIAIALTEFEALCGFRPRKEIETALSSIPQLKELLGDGVVNSFTSGVDGIRPCFEALMNCSSDQVKAAIDGYLSGNDNSTEKILAERLNKQFPGDVGVLCVFWLNYVVLSPGEALFLAPNEPHAYIYGDCVECMSNSDNVVRAGLTPKFRDVNTLCDMLTYQSHHPSEIKFQPVKEDDHSFVFRPPVKDFAVAQITIPAGQNYSLQPRNSASIILTVSGSSLATSSIGTTTAMTLGVVLFLPAYQKLTVVTESQQVLYQAFCNL